MTELLEQMIEAARTTGTLDTDLVQRAKTEARRLGRILHVMDQMVLGVEHKDRVSNITYRLAEIALGRESRPLDRLIICPDNHPFFNVETQSMEIRFCADCKDVHLTATGTERATISMDDLQLLFPRH